MVSGQNIISKTAASILWVIRVSAPVVKGCVPASATRNNR
jgi:hypothetical protein